MSVIRREKSTSEVLVVLRRLEHNTNLVLHLMRHLECRVSEDEARTLTAEANLADRLAAIDPVARAEEAEP